MKNTQEYLIFCDMLDAEVQRFNALDEDPMNRLTFSMAINKAKMAAYDAFLFEREMEVVNAA